jgi:hypothetical protein
MYKEGEKQNSELDAGKHAAVLTTMVQLRTSASQRAEGPKWPSKIFSATYCISPIEAIMRTHIIASPGK